jgi:UDP-N-acetylmuramate dehydrogenase
MKNAALRPTALSALRAAFGDRLQENAPLSGYTSARIGGPADALVFVRSAGELEQAVRTLWDLGLPCLLLGGGSNVLVSDRGVRGVVLVNRARTVKFHSRDEVPSVWAESGATLNDIAQRAARLSLSGLEWAASVPGSLGGAVYGNAGAFGGEMVNNLVSLDLLFRSGRETWPVEKMAYGYRTSRLKRERPEVFILSATLKLSHGEMPAIQAVMAANTEKRRKTQPPGASMGSMFKNPPGDKAGRLIEAAGLKGMRIGNAEISSQHANFFINTDGTSAEDMRRLLELAQKTVWEKFSVSLEPEIELVGEW